MRGLFRRLAERTAHAVGSPWAFLLALLTIAVWGVAGPPSPMPRPFSLVVKNGSNTRSRTSGDMPEPVSEIDSCAYSPGVSSAWKSA
jgi:low affinity iron permease